MTGIKNTIPIIAIVVSIASYSFWKIASDAGWNNLFYHGVALSFVLLSYALVLETPHFSLRKRAYYVLLILSLSNLCDEIFFDPKVIEVNEYVFAVLIIIHQVYLYFHARRKP